MLPWPSGVSWQRESLDHLRSTRSRPLSLTTPWLYTNFKRPFLTTTEDPIATEPANRRTFAIISHPDAGKTTLTEELLLFGGAIRLAGHVKARGERRRTQSDWMEMERARGISVSSSVMTFEHEGLVFNLLDTPGHQDFSEDTYRT